MNRKHAQRGVEKFVTLDLAAGHVYTCIYIYPEKFQELNFSCCAIFFSLKITSGYNISRFEIFKILICLTIQFNFLQRELSQ